jgi:acetylornithine deacetylase/succinyl-diaminopimelate desuccinylase-like protein
VLGHGSMPSEDNPVLGLAAALTRLTPTALPVRPTAAVSRLIRALAQAQPFLARLLMPMLLKPALADALLARMPDQAMARNLNALLRDTVVPTVLRAGHKTNVIPSTAEAELDGRILPGQTAEGLMRELKALLGEGVELELLHALEPVETSAETPMYEAISRAVRAMDPEGIAVPYVTPGFTDAAAFARLGVSYYGFCPLYLPSEPHVSFGELYHGDNERIPVEGFKRGLSALYQTVYDWCR